MYYVVRYTGPMGYIKPWTAVRDSLTFSEKFLSPATVAGMSQKLFGLGQDQRIARYRLCFDAYSVQQEQTWSPEHKWEAKTESINRGQSILERGILLNPELILAFDTLQDAEVAYEQHLCLCRNEDLVFPDAEFGIQALTPTDFESLTGFELVASDSDSGVPVGRNRFIEGHPMTYGQLVVRGNPVRMAF